MKQYQNLIRNVMLHGDVRMDRTGVGTIALFHQTLKFDLNQGFPAVTTKKLAFETCMKELSWMLKGERDIALMQADGCKIWDGNVEADYWQDNKECLGERDAGRIYGVQWRNWRCDPSKDSMFLDQLRTVVDRIKNNPSDRRLVVTAWNPGELDEMCLPPCHMFFQFFVRDGKYLDCAVYMRSVDVILGLPFDIASYAMLTTIVANECGLKASRLYWTLGDTHIYQNHLDAAKTIIDREPYQAPQLRYDGDISIDNFEWYNVKLENYKHHEPVKAELNV
ncbi:thymidylate synthase [Candidatus Fermentibacteria bacterium]|nr:MAG: thymidylate synthase [Candidatus Fermentibacteria bacterium]